MSTGRWTRRAFLHRGAAGGVAAAALPLGAHGGAFPGALSPELPYLDILRVPESVTMYTGSRAAVALERRGEEWGGRGGLMVGTRETALGLVVTLAAPATAVERVHLRWQGAMHPRVRVLGDAWERSYGELAWRGLTPERVMPWYFSVTHSEAEDGVCHAYGVKTGAGALCFWQVDAQGVSLWLDTSNGGAGVQLGGRLLHAATVVARRGHAGVDAQSALSAFCRELCSRPSRPLAPVYGFNDWYYAYGRSTAASILADTEFLASLSSGSAVRPFSIVDDGWQDRARFPDMGALAGEIKARGVRPGVWVRPLAAGSGTAGALLLPEARFGERRERATERAYDPTIPEARELVLGKVTELVEWGYELVKHDFSTYDLLGQWGFEMGATPALPGWSLHNRSRTNAEVIGELYAGIRERCDPPGKAGALVLGCNAVGHLGQGLFDLQRTGDDTSGRVWERTRRMGVNTLAFRLPQHGSFFVGDADCVGIAPEVPWERNRQWLDVLARSGTAVFVSPGEGSRGAEQAAVLRAAFALAARGGTGARPVSWMEETTPGAWVERGGGAVQYDWCGVEGASPFPV